LTLSQATVLHAAGKRKEAIKILLDAAETPIVLTDQAALFGAFREIKAFDEALKVINDLEKKTGRPVLTLDLVRAQVYEDAGRFQESADAYRKIMSLLKPGSGARGAVQKLLEKVEAKMAAKKKKASK